MGEENEVRVDVGFALAGPPVPLDHGYVLFGSIASILGDLHQAKWLAIHPLRGTPLPEGRLALVKRRAALRLRVVPAEIPRVLELAGKTLRVAGSDLHVGVSTLEPIKPHPCLVARLVVIKGFCEEEPFSQAVRRQLTALGAECAVEVGRRRVLQIAGDNVVGFGVRLNTLSDESSLRVQYLGLGGRQRMGCGVFVPLREERKQ